MYYPWFNPYGPYNPMKFGGTYCAQQAFIPSSGLENAIKKTDEQPNTWAKEAERLNQEKIERIETLIELQKKEIEKLALSMSQEEQTRRIIQALQPNTVPSYPADTIKYYADGIKYEEAEVNTIEYDEAESVRTKEDETVCEEPWLALFISFLFSIALFICFHLLGGRGSPVNTRLSVFGICCFIFGWLKIKLSSKK